jgi:hypothetical protein
MIDDLIKHPIPGIPKKAWDLDGKLFKLYLLMLHMAVEHERELCVISNSELSKATGESVRSIATYLKQLEMLDYIKINRKKSPNRGIKTVHSASLKKYMTNNSSGRNEPDWMDDWMLELTELKG